MRLHEEGSVATDVKTHPSSTNSEKPHTESRSERRKRGKKQEEKKFEVNYTPMVDMILLSF